MGKLKDWMIHKLGGYSQQDWTGLINRWSIRHAAQHPQMVTAAYSYYVLPDTEETRRIQERAACKALANKIATEMLERGLIRLTKQLDFIQDRTAKRYRMKATALAVDPAVAEHMHEKED